VKQKSSLQHNRSFLKVISGLVIILGLLFLASGNHSLSQGLFNQQVDTQARTYQLQVHSSYDNITRSFYGTQQLTLKISNSSSIQGHLLWNLTWDNGKTWYAENASYIYFINRTYQYAGLTCYTAWWIHPAVQIGDQIQIDGDVPATNNFLRLAPFIVTDLLSLEVNQQHYLCWQLTYNSPNYQHETYYYEYHTGILLSATSVQFEAHQPVHEVWLELQTADQLPPPISPLLHFWTNYNSTLIAFIGATTVTLLGYYLLQRIRPPQDPFPLNSGQ